MTKTLTEQWKDGKLHFGFYYVKFPNEEPQIYSSEYLKSFTVVKDVGRIDILAPVPSYKEYKKLKEQLKEANMVIKRELRRQSPKDGVLLGDMNDYLEKWGVR